MKTPIPPGSRRRSCCLRWGPVFARHVGDDAGVAGPAIGIDAEDHAWLDRGRIRLGVSRLDDRGAGGLRGVLPVPPDAGGRRHGVGLLVLAGGFVEAPIALPFNAHPGRRCALLNAGSRMLTTPSHINYKPPFLRRSSSRLSP